ncbi:MAG TPA: hypothetical protein VHC68_02965 [Candidatus Paceibacterota bacterium]|nr:hypothetical protein [Candidatus Paceibacterota bacterium]
MKRFHLYRVRFWGAYRPETVAALGALGVLFTILAATLVLLHGHFSYAFDDPYIGLALAENIARFGHYGVNLVEYSSPSSSILYPFLLVPFFWIGIPTAGPLILAFFFTAATAALCAWYFSKRLRFSDPLAAGLALGLAAAAGAFGVAFSGLEHSLHILATVLLAFALIEFVRAQWSDGAVSSRWLWVLVGAAILNPLIRFEGLALSACVMVILVCARRVGAAALALAGIAGCLGIYMLAMQHLGLPLLPSSVLTKESSAALIVGAPHGFLGGVLGTIIRQLFANLRGMSPQLAAALIGPFLLLAGYVAFADRGCRAEKVLSWGALGVLALYFCFGNVLSLRYDCFLIAFALALIAYVYRETIQNIARLDFGRIAALAVLAALVFAIQIKAAAFIPLAADNIYLQQYQMHRLAVLLDMPVAVNDLGWVSYENDQYVLDLFGLASEPARQARAAHDLSYAERLAREYNVHFAMVYPELLGEYLPGNWVRIGTLQFSVRKVNAANSSVSLYAFDLTPEACRALANRIAAFGSSLPSGASLTTDPAACAAL